MRKILERIFKRFEQEQLKIDNDYKEKLEDL